MLIASQQSLQTLLADNLPLLILASAIMASGLAAVAAYAVARKSRERILLWFGLFAGPYGLELITRNPAFRLAFGPPPQFFAGRLPGNMPLRFTAITRSAFTFYATQPPGTRPRSFGATTPANCVGWRRAVCLLACARTRSIPGARSRCRRAIVCCCIPMACWKRPTALDPGCPSIRAKALSGHKTPLP